MDQRTRWTTAFRKMGIDQLLTSLRRQRSLATFADGCRTIYLLGGRLSSIPSYRFATAGGAFQLAIEVLPECRKNGDGAAEAFRSDSRARCSSSPMAPNSELRT